MRATRSTLAAPTVRVLLLAALLLTVTACGFGALPVSAPAPVPATPEPPTLPAPAGRDAGIWPFSSTSPWNMPAGSGAQFAGGSDPRTVDLLAGGGYINAVNWSHPVYQASASDPMRRVTDPSGTTTYRIPAGATPSAPQGGDMHMHVVDPTKHSVDESWKTTPNGADWSSGDHVRNDLYGPGIGAGGVRAYGGSAIAGLIRRGELQSGAIPHALAFAVPRAQMKPGPVWPATSEDSGASTTYLGHLPMGSFAAIPATVDVASLGLSPGGLAIAKALQDYGAYLVDAAGQFVFYAEPSSEPLLAGARADVATIRAQLRVVTNNSVSNVGGGGIPRAPLAPPLL